MPGRPEYSRYLESAAGLIAHAAILVATSEDVGSLPLAACRSRASQARLDSNPPESRGRRELGNAIQYGRTWGQSRSLEFNAMRVGSVCRCLLIGIMSTPGLISQQGGSPGPADRESLRKQFVEMFSSSTCMDGHQHVFSGVDMSPLSPVTHERKTTATITAKCACGMSFDYAGARFRCETGSSFKFRFDATLSHPSTGWTFDTVALTVMDQTSPAALIPGPILPRPTLPTPQNRESVLKLAESSGGKVMALAMGTYASLAFVNVAGTMHLRLVAAHEVSDVACGSAIDGPDWRVVPLGCPGTTEVVVPPATTRAEVYRLDGTVTLAQVYSRGPQRIYRVQLGDQAIILVHQ